MQSKVKSYWANEIKPLLCAGHPDLEQQAHFEEVVHIRPGAAMLQWVTKFNILLQALLEGEGEEHWRPSGM